jgi:hypothetical protein
MTIAERKEDIAGREKVLAKERQAKADGMLLVSELESRRRNFAVAAAVKSDASTSAQLTDIEKDLDKARNDVERHEIAVEGIEVTLDALRQSLARAEFEDVRGAAIKQISSIMASKREIRLCNLLDEIVLTVSQLQNEYMDAASAMTRVGGCSTNSDLGRSHRSIHALAGRNADLIIEQLGYRLLDRHPYITVKRDEIYGNSLVVLDNAIQILKELKPPKVDPQ